MPVAPSNITASNIDGVYVKVTWTDTNNPACTARLWDSSGQWSQPFANNDAGRSAVIACPSGARTLQLSLKDQWGGESTKTQFTVTPAAPPPSTAEALLEQALGVSLSAGDRVEVFPPAPTFSKAVQADGSLA
jgi:hypothetical protein